ncbi:MAG: hypothetical protein HYZ37_10960 [Candidatus Solibacter usitatus]|nr:hypothetical protein [Candidatus Solibacter usitatus]
MKLRRWYLYWLPVLPIAYAAMQSNPAAPGRTRPDAPAVHEKNREKIVVEAATERLMDPRQPDADPPSDPRLSRVMRLTDDTRSDDFPAIAVNPKDRSEVWCAWASYSGKQDRVHLSRHDPSKDSWGAWSVVPESIGDVWRPQLTFDSKGRLWVSWAMQVNKNFDLYARWFDGENWGPLERITNAPQGDFDHRIATDASGKLHVVWQGFRNGQSDIFLSTRGDAGWSREVRVSDSPRNDWAPAIAADSKGNVVIAWDTYDKGNYDVRMRTLSNGVLSNITAVAETPRFEAHASLAFDNTDRLWIAYEAGPVGWAKDQGRLTPNATSPGTMILDERNVEVAAYMGTQRLGMTPDVRAMFENRKAKAYVPESPAIVIDPQLVTDDRGRVHLLARNQEGRAFATYFREYVLTLTGEGWSKPAPLPFSQGRVSMRAAGAAAGNGQLWLAWPRDNDPKFSIFINLPEETMIENVYAGKYDAGSTTGAKIDTRLPQVAARAAGHEKEDAQVAAIRAYRTEAGGRKLRILRGDLHRHTELSPDLRGMPDGSILDFYRYMMDAASMDFGMISDHQNGGDREYWWWITEKAADLHHSPPNYVSLYGYERSVTYPNGHRNIVHTERGYAAVPFFLKPSAPMRLHNGGGNVIEGDTKMLYGELRKTGGIAISHTSATTMGTDWRDNDLELEPVVEIFQGDRYSYECDGCPLSNDGRPGNPALEAARPLGFVHNALAKGYRLGFIASSDHLSTHMSYALVFAEDTTREAIQMGMRKRATYAATDNIIADFRAAGRFMGEEFSSSAAPTLNAKITGTAPIDDIVIVRDNKVVYQASPKTEVAELSFQDREASAGLHYYYLRAVQRDRQAVWCSPVWVRVGNR